MRKTVVLPEWRSIESDTLDEPISAYGVVTHRPGYKHVMFSGSAWPKGDIAEQTRQILHTSRTRLPTLAGV